MSDYTKLIEDLKRGFGHWYVEDWSRLVSMYADAAAAIEELQDELEEQKQIAEHYEQSAKDWWKEAEEYYTIASAKDITAEESEELIRQFKKLPCGPIERLEPKRGEMVEVVRCKDCKHRPTGTGVNHDIEFPDSCCPCQCYEDYWYSWMPSDDWYCANGEKMEV